MITAARPLLFCALAVCGLAAGIGTATSAEDDPASLVDFADPGEAERWRIVNDGVMGGVSRSRISLTGDGTAVFEGVVSLENNGGFASVRRAPADYGLSGKTGLELRVRGDGKRYQLRLRTGDRFDGVSWQSSFETESDEWTVVRIPFDAFRATFRGSAVRDAGRLDLARVRQIGILIADKQAGGFRLEVGAIRAY